MNKKTAGLTHLPLEHLVASRLLGEENQATRPPRVSAIQSAMY